MLTQPKNWIIKKFYLFFFLFFSVCSQVRNWTGSTMLGLDWGCGREKHRVSGGRWSPGSKWIWSCLEKWAFTLRVSYIKCVSYLSTPHDFAALFKFNHRVFKIEYYLLNHTTFLKTEKKYHSANGTSYYIVRYSNFHSLSLVSNHMKCLWFIGSNNQFQFQVLFVYFFIFFIRDNLIVQKVWDSYFQNWLLNPWAR